MTTRRDSDPQANLLDVGDWAWMDWPRCARDAREDSRDGWSWRYKNQLRELDGNPLVERYSARRLR